MLFTVKRDAAPSFSLALVIVAVAVVAQQALGIDWTLAFDVRVGFTMVIGLLAIGLLDAVVHGSLLVVTGDAYRRTFRALAEYYRNQPTLAVLAGGLLAGAEELLFRGVVLLGLVELAAVPAPVAVVAAAVLFGAAHYIPRWELRPFAAWAVLEGLVLGGLLVVTDSLLVPVVVHTLHDVLGFALFAWLRRERIQEE